jgi:hypothetical protein
MKFLRLIHSIAPITPPALQETQETPLLHSPLKFHRSTSPDLPRHQSVPPTDAISAVHLQSTRIEHGACRQCRCNMHRSSIDSPSSFKGPLNFPPRTTSLSLSLSLSLSVFHTIVFLIRVSLPPQSIIQELIKKHRILGWLALAGESGRIATAGESWSSSMDTRGM